MPLETLGDGWEPRISRVLAALGPELDPGAPVRDALCRLLDSIVIWNRRLDLTAARGPDELVDLTLADAAVLAQAHRDAGGESWVDVGSGAGAPGLPLALLAPRLRMTLIEPKTKRVAFLRTTLATVGRTDVAVERARSDALEAGRFDVAVSRATLAPAAWLAEGARLARRSVWVLVAGAEAPVLAGFVCDADRAYAWPLTGAERRALRFTRSGL